MYSRGKVSIFTMWDFSPQQHVHIKSHLHVTPKYYVRVYPERGLGLGFVCILPFLLLRYHSFLHPLGFSTAPPTPPPLPKKKTPPPAPCHATGFRFGSVSPPNPPNPHHPSLLPSFVFFLVSFFRHRARVDHFRELSYVPEMCITYLRT